MKNAWKFILEVMIVNKNDLIKFYMKLRSKKFILALPIHCLILSYQTLFGQRISEYVNAYVGQNGEGYSQPLLDLFTSGLNTGLWNTTPRDSGFQFRIGVTGMIAIPSNNQQTFTGITEAPFAPEQTATVPTIVGEIESVTVIGNNGTACIFPGGFNLSLLPTAVPEISIGSVLGTSIHARFLGFEIEKDFGDYRHWGIGVQHSLSQYFKKMPFLFHLGYYYQSLQIGQEVGSNFHIISLQAAKAGTLGYYYLQIAYHHAKMDLDFEYEDDDTLEIVNIDLENDFPFHLEIGGELKAWIFRLRGAIRPIPPIGASIGLNFAF